MKAIKHHEEYFWKRLGGHLDHQDGKKELCGGGFRLRMKIRMVEADADAFLVAAADNLCNRLKTDWDWHRDPKGEI